METLFHINTNTETEIYYQKDKSIFWPILYVVTAGSFDFVGFFCLISTKMKLEFCIFLYVLLQSDGFVPFIVHYVIHIKINHFIVIDHQFIIKNVTLIVVLVSPFLDSKKKKKN